MQVRKQQGKKTEAKGPGWAPFMILAAGEGREFEVSRRVGLGGPMGMVDLELESPRRPAGC